MPKSPTTILGFDFGMRRIGVAVGQTITQTAEPLPILSAKDGIPDWSSIEKYIDTWKADALVVGLPYNLDGSEQEVTKAARKFANRLADKFRRPVHLVDERFTSVAAEQELRALHKTQQLHIDSYAAVLILESWLRKAHNDETH